LRISVWLVLLVISAALVYLNQIGLPDFVKRPLLEKLRARGLDLQFSRLRVRWPGALVADNVRFERADEPSSPQLNVREVQVLLDPAALCRFQLQVEALILRRGQFAWPVAETNTPARALTIDRIQTELRFMPDDRWALDKFQAEFAGAQIHLSGVVSNASAVRDWKLLQPKSRAPLARWQERLARFSDALLQIHFSAPPELRLDVRGDARVLPSFTARTYLSAPGAQTPWGTVNEVRFLARVLPATNQELTRAEIDLQALDAQTRWGTITNFTLSMSALSEMESPTQVVASLTLSAGRAWTQWGHATNARFNAHWVHSVTNPVPLEAQGKLDCEFVQSEWGSAHNLEFAAKLATPAEALPPLDPALAWWTNIQPYALEWEGHLADLRSTNLQVRSLSAAGSWHSPELTVTNLNAAFDQGGLIGHGQLQLSGHLDVSTRSLEARLQSSVDPAVVAPALTEGARQWLSQFTWGAPPQLSGQASLILPAWTNQHPDWRAEVQPTLQLDGQFRLDQGATYRAIPVSTAQSHFSYSNDVWQLPDLVLTRPEGRLVASHQANDRTKEFHWQLLSMLDPNFVRPALQTNQTRGLDYFTFTQPPVIEAEVWGHSHEPERTGVKARVALTNFTFRGEAISGCQTLVQYTNRSIEFTDPRIQRGTQYLAADGLVVDLGAEKIYMTNGTGIAEPELVTRLIGPKVAHALEPYQFRNPPTAHAYGVIPIHRDEDADLHFDLDGGPFHWFKFNVRHISGHVHWAGQNLTITNVQTEFYEGAASGWAAFDFLPEHRTDFEFSLTTTNTLLQKLMADLSRETNHLEGRLSGTLLVSRASAEDWRSVQGRGNLFLRDGLIWDLPLFGIFSPVLDGLIPGLGNSRATAATCSFTITDGVIHSDDLQIHTPMMQLDYHGTVDLQRNVNAKVDAALLRNIPAIGPLMTIVLWPVTKLFEYRVTGTLSQPKTEPMFLVPKIVLMPFHPLRTLRGLFPEEPSANRGEFSEDLSPPSTTPSTNAPPTTPPRPAQNP
jgi:hypothetical protein